MNYDAMHRISSVQTATGDGTLLQSFTVTRDPAGRPLRVDGHDGALYEYVHDPLSWLTSERFTDATGQMQYEKSYSYDAVGNRLQTLFYRADAGPLETLFTYDEVNRITSAGGTDYHWDGNGNLAAIDGVAAYHWDIKDQLRGVDLENGTALRYSYNADGILTHSEKTKPGAPPEVISFLNDITGPISQVVAESDSSGQLQRLHIDADRALGLIGPDGPVYIHSDWGGSTSLLTSEAGEAGESFSYEAFGMPQSSEGSPPLARLYRGEVFDPESHLYYLRARWMDPETGRFISRDPLHGSLEQPITQHTYAYANLDPLRQIDPTGLFGQAAGNSAIGNPLQGSFKLDVLDDSPTFHPVYLSPWSDLEVRIELQDTKSVYSRYGIYLLFDQPQAPPAEMLLSTRMLRTDALERATGWWTDHGYAAIAFIGDFNVNLGTDKAWQKWMADSAQGSSSPWGASIPPLPENYYYGQANLLNRPAIAVNHRAIKQSSLVTAHEIGHILLDTAAHAGEGSILLGDWPECELPPYNLMCVSGPGSPYLTQGQLLTMRTFMKKYNEDGRKARAKNKAGG